MTNQPVRSKIIYKMCACAFLAALSIVFGKFLAISTDVIRISFENLPVILAGIIFGPLWGGAVGVGADLVGSVMRGYAINPIITLGAAAVGLTAGAVWIVLKKLPYPVRILLSVLFAHALGSVLIKTIGLVVVYKSPVFLFIQRSGVYFCNTVIESVIIFVLLSSKEIKRLFRRRN